MTSVFTKPLLALLGLISITAVGTVGTLAVRGFGSGVDRARQSSLGVPFTISGVAASVLEPGSVGARINLVFANPNSSPITVRKIVATVTGSSAGSACAADDFAISQLAATALVPGRHTTSLRRLAVPESKWPRVRMLHNTDVRACAGATVKLGYVGKATG